MKSVKTISLVVVELIGLIILDLLLCIGLVWLIPLRGTILAVIIMPICAIIIVIGTLFVLNHNLK